MKKKNMSCWRSGWIVFCSILLIACNNTDAQSGTSEMQADDSYQMVDHDASNETRALLANLYRIKNNHMLFGHQDTLAYGVKWQGEEGRSDIKDVTGSFPALYGWELGGLGIGQEANLDKVNFANMQRWIKEVYLRGGVNTISWHMYDPVTGHNSWTKDASVQHLVPGGKAHDKFKQYLDTFVAFNQQLKVTDKQGNQVSVPIIFRPWHEHTGDWFWWGKGHTAEKDYIALWRFTVDYLKSQGVHNLIYAYSPDRGRIALDNYEADYLYGYPGDDYVDVLGIDTYTDLGRDESITVAQQKDNFRRTLEYTVELANKKHKLPAVSEGGWDGIKADNYWTDRILDVVTHNDTTRQIAYLMVWRNANKQRENKDHFYAPYPGHPSADNFKQFYADPYTLFEDSLPDMYRLHR
ncbi:glycoside hydrolase family 26 protein [Neptunicella sp. SCSIO 80796]|uniref:glycoside hydrolase family 26 protein n=1 Tax=Neptunicella plasticusilytica TaxID=3117012 RepID=UPI003A4D7DED